MNQAVSTLAPALLLAAALPFLGGAASPRPAPAAAPQAGEYEIDAVHSSVVFRVRHMGVANFYGAFESLSGSVSYDPADVSKSAIEIEIAPDSVDSNHPDRDAHIESPDFLNAKEFPVLAFRSTKVAARGDDELLVTGDLTLRGVTRSVEVPVQVTGYNPKSMWDDQRVGFEAELALESAKFDLAYVEKFPENALSHTIHLIVSLECAKR